MARNGVYGVAKFLMQEAVANGFPTDDSWATAFEMKAIVKDSLSYNDQAASENDIEVEDMDLPYASLPSSLATKGFTVQTYDLSKEAYVYLMGYEEKEGWVTETPGKKLGNQAVQITTKALAEFSAKVFEWANLSAKVTRTGTIGKSGFPNLNIEFKQEVLTDESGKEIGGARWKALS